VSSNPKDGAVIKSAPTTVSITFAENVDPKGSDIVVYDATHKQVSTGQATVSASDLKTMTVPMQGNGDGIYFVEWHTVSADDGDPDIGGFNFTVGTSDTATPGSGSSPSTTATATNAAGVPVWIAVLIGVVGLVLGAGGAVVAARRSK
jgi:methionine-rich copper-binding protein CopC